MLNVGVEEGEFLAYKGENDGEIQKISGYFGEGTAWNRKYIFSGGALVAVLLLQAAVSAVVPIHNSTKLEGWVPAYFDGGRVLGWKIHFPQFEKANARQNEPGAHQLRVKGVLLKEHPSENNHHRLKRVDRSGKPVSRRRVGGYAHAVGATRGSQQAKPINWKRVHLSHLVYPKCSGPVEVCSSIRE